MHSGHEHSSWSETFLQQKWEEKRIFQLDFDFSNRPQTTYFVAQSQLSRIKSKIANEIDEQKKETRMN